MIPALGAGGAGAAILLRSAWRRRTAATPLVILGTWIAVTALVLLAAWSMGAARGPLFAIALLPLGAALIVAAGTQRRAVRGHVARSRALEPSLRPSKVWRGVLRTLVAGPLGCIAALTLGITWTVSIPADAQTRIVLGGVLVPLLWAGAMAWALTDDRIARPALSMLGLILAGAALIAIVGF